MNEWMNWTRFSKQMHYENIQRVYKDSYVIAISHSIIIFLVPHFDPMFGFLNELLNDLNVWSKKKWVIKWFLYAISKK